MAKHEHHIWQMHVAFTQRSKRYLPAQVAGRNFILFELSGTAKYPPRPGLTLYLIIKTECDACPTAVTWVQQIHFTGVFNPFRPARVGTQRVWWPTNSEQTNWKALRWLSGKRGVCCSTRSCLQPLWPVRTSCSWKAFKQWFISRGSLQCSSSLKRAPE